MGNGKEGRVNGVRDDDDDDDYAEPKNAAIFFTYSEKNSSGWTS